MPRQLRGPTAPAPSNIAANSRVLRFACASPSGTPAHWQTARHRIPCTASSSTTLRIRAHLPTAVRHCSANSSVSRSTAALPQAWSRDRERRAAAHIPTDITFATKPALAIAMLNRAGATALPLALLPHAFLNVMRSQTMEKGLHG